MQLLHLSKCASITWRLEWERELCAEITFSDFLGIAMPMPMPMPMQCQWERELYADVAFSDFLGIAMPMQCQYQCQCQCQCQWERELYADVAFSDVHRNCNGQEKLLLPVLAIDSNVSAKIFGHRKRVYKSL